MGDEIIIPSGRNLLYLRLLQDPKLSKVQDWQGRPKYISIRCSIKVNSVPYPGYGPGALPFYKNVPECTAEGHNLEKYVNLNNKAIWREKEFY